MGGSMSCIKGEKPQDNLSQSFGDVLQSNKGVFPRKRSSILRANQTHVAQQCLDKADFEDRLKDAGQKLVIVDFFANWCEPCRVIGPEVEKLAAEHRDVVFLKVEVDGIEELVTEYEISTLPTFVAIIDGKKIDAMSDSRLEKLVEFLNKYKK